MKQRRTWLWVGLALVGAAVLIFVAIAAVGVTLVMRNLEVSRTSESSAERDFEVVRRRFAGQRPLLSVEEDGHLTQTELVKRAAEHKGPRATTLRVMAFDHEDEKIARLSIPLWLMRFGSRGSYRVHLGDSVKFDEVKLDPDDIERAGPALLLDHSDKDTRVLLWTE